MPGPHPGAPGGRWAGWWSLPPSPRAPASSSRPFWPTARPRPIWPSAAWDRPARRLAARPPARPAAAAARRRSAGQDVRERLRARPTPLPIRTRTRRPAGWRATWHPSPPRPACRWSSPTGRCAAGTAVSPGMMTITNRSRSAIPSWLLFVHYRRARMDRVRGARWYPASTHVPGAGVVAPRRDQLVLQPGASAEFTFRASGHFGPPAGCFFDTARCRFHPTRRLKPLSARGSQWSHRPARNERGRPGNGAGLTRGMPGPGGACAGRNDRCEIPGLRGSGRPAE